MKLFMPASREARATIQFVDEYCQLFKELFPEVRSYEAFKLLHLGMISEIKRKSLPAIVLVGGTGQSANLTPLSNGVTLVGATATLEAIGINSQSVAGSVTDFTD